MNINNQSTSVSFPSNATVSGPEGVPSVSFPNDAIGIDVTIRNSDDFIYEENGVIGTGGHSNKTSFRWDGWNTTITYEFNYVDIKFVGNNLALNIRTGYYVSYKPVQILGAEVLVLGLVLGGLYLAPIAKPVILTFGKPLIDVLTNKPVLQP